MRQKAKPCVEKTYNGFAFPVYLWYCFIRREKEVRTALKRHFEQLWRALTIKKKILLFTGAVFIVCLLSVILNVWVVRFSLVDFNRILEQNTNSINLVQALETENDYFKNYMQHQDGVTEEMLSEAIENTEKAVYEMPFDYGDIGAERYSRTWSMRSSYEVYVEKRTEFMNKGRENEHYVRDLYRIYEMQDYLLLYARNLMTDTLEVSGVEYKQKIPGLLGVPLVVIGAGIAFLFAAVKLAQLMNDAIIVPVMKLVGASKSIADNDFFIEDVQVENKDELGELVHAFNKMKYATGEYISALEEKRATLDLLHAEEMEKIKVQRRLESIRLDLLKSQVNPHFLFNTLNVIGGMANIEEAETTEKMIKALSSLFRYNLKTDDIIVPLARELKVVEDYMYLQQMRFGERIGCDIVCEADKDKTFVPAFTFQPLAENAIIHGLARKEEGGRLRIRIKLKKDGLHIAFGDTGKGMKTEELLRLREKLWESEAEEGHRGIGLGNIFRRVNAMYPDGKVEIYSKENVGTVVVVVIPQRGGESYVSDTGSG